MGVPPDDVGVRLAAGQGASRYCVASCAAYGDLDAHGNPHISTALPNRHSAPHFDPGRHHYPVPYSYPYPDYNCHDAPHSYPHLHTGARFHFYTGVPFPNEYAASPAGWRDGPAGTDELPTADHQ